MYVLELGDAGISIGMICAHQYIIFQSAEAAQGEAFRYAIAIGFDKIKRNGVNQAGIGIGNGGVIESIVRYAEEQRGG